MKTKNSSSMRGVIKNVAHLCKRDRSKTCGKEGEKLVVCIVAKVNSKNISVIAAMCCYQECIAKTKIGERDVTAHISEYTIQISTTPSFKIETSEKGVAPVQVNILPQREKPKESKFPPMVLQRPRTNPPTQCLRPPTSAQCQVRPQSTTSGKPST